MSILKDVTNASQGKIEASKKIGDNKLKGGIDTKNEAIELGINFKVGGLGISTDYGGAIKVDIAGQSITWGREGGKIHYNVFGFEVIVEARNCIVTETKKIAGIVVASHTYPDPGCKLPEPPTPTPTPTPGGGITNYPTFSRCASSRGTSYLYDIGTWVLVGNYVYKNSEGFSRGAYTFFAESLSLRKQYIITNNGENVQEDEKMANLYWGHGNWRATEETRQQPSTEGQWIWHADFTPQFNNLPKNGSCLSQVARIVFIYNFKLYKRIGASAGSYSFGSAMYNPRFEVLSVEPPPPCNFGTPENLKPRPFLPTGNKPPMNQDCCDEILDILEEFRDVLLPKEILKVKGASKGRLLEKQTKPLKSGEKRAKLKDKAFTNYPAAIDGILSELEAFEKVLHSDFLIEKKFPIPLNLLIPGANGEVEAETFYHLIKHLFQSLAHGTIINPVVTIQDIDSAKEGDQSLTTQYMSATGWAEAVTKMLYEITDDGNVGTNMDIRTGVTVTQLLVAVADLSARVDCIIDAIGVTTIRKKGEIETSYNLVLDKEDKTKGKGFDPKKSNQKLDLNSDMETEKLLPHLLKSRVNPIVIESVHPKASSLFEMLQDLKKKE